MGKIIKGSPEQSERYIVGVPLFIAADAEREERAALDDATFTALDLDCPIGGVAALDVAPEATIDLEAIHAQTQALIDDAGREAQAIIDEARQRADGLIAEATERSYAVAADTRLAAHESGYATGVQSAHEELDAMLSTMRGLIEATRDERHALINVAEPELVRLAVAIAERVLHQQIALDGGVVVEMAKAAISRIVDREKITVRVNPADVEKMREHREALLALGDVKTMRVIEDQRVDRGGVIIETDAGSVDAKISTQLGEVRKLLHIVDDVVVQPAHPRDLYEADLAAARAS